VASGYSGAICHRSRDHADEPLTAIRLNRRDDNRGLFNRARTNLDAFFQPGRLIMKKTLFSFIAAAALVVATGCVTQTTIGGTADRHGLFGGYSAASNTTGDSTEIASYTVVFGLFDAGHADYAAKVKAAEAQGKKITTKTMWFILATKTTAYAK
jgi:hypothetical protein